MSRLVSILTLLACPLSAFAQEKNYPQNAYFGDLHVHTRDSLDAYLLNTTTTPDQAYHFARGRKLKITGVKEPVQLDVPLDFTALTDHSEFFGIMAIILNPRFEGYYSDFAKRLRKGERDEDWDPHEIYLFDGKFPPAEMDISGANAGAALLWESQMETADRHNQAEDFTAFIAYEWTAGLANNMHRNVIFEGKGPPLPWSSDPEGDSATPEELWSKMAQFRKRGFDSVAIPHNANLSGGMMYKPTGSNRVPIDAEYAGSRSFNEPLAEIMQTKGASETRPSIATEDEFANFELEPPGQRLIGPPTEFPELTDQFSYVRQALKLGLKHAEEIKVNPFKQGVVGGTDSHNGTPGNTVESKYVGQHGDDDNTPALRLEIDSAGDGSGSRINPGDGNLVNNPGGLTGIWANENSREALFSALRRRETFATSGTRLRVRFFGGWNLEADADRKPDIVEYCYENGVPMGADLPTKPKSPKAKPVFVIWAVKDPHSALLERIQIVKGWMENGEPQENVIDVEVSSGSKELSATWIDSDFEPDQRAFYYARILEKPTKRWSTYDAETLRREGKLKLGARPLKGIPRTIQERAWSSSIWYTPG